MTAVLSGQADIGFSGPEAAIYVYNEGREDYAVVFAQLTKRDGSFWWEENQNRILNGKPQRKDDNRRRKGGVPEMTLEYVLKKNNLIPGVDVYIDTSVQFALMAGAFTEDRVTMLRCLNRWLPQWKGRQGYIITSIGKESGEIPYTAYYATRAT